jgi:hypothetical protein
MCRLFSNLGFVGKYVLFDLPLFSALQRYYLRSLGIACADLQEPHVQARVGTVNDVDTLKQVVAPRERTLFIATWSLCEAPLAVRNQLLPFIAGCTSVLFSYSHQFGEVDNQRYFADLQEKLDHVFTWQDFAIPHLPNNRYLFGVAKA